MKLLISIAKHSTWWYAVPFCLLALLLLSELGDRFQLFPDNLSYENLSVYNDSGDGGKSIIYPPDKPGDTQQLKFSLVDNKKYFIPFVGYSINCKDVEKEFSLTSYDEISFEISVDHKQTCHVLLNMYFDKACGLDSTVRDVALTCEVPLYKNQREYIVSLDDFFIPDWWLVENDLVNDTIDRRYLKKIRTINLHLGAQDSNYSNDVRLYNISFLKNKTVYYWIWLLGSAVYFLLLVAIQHIVKQHTAMLKQREKIVVPYDTLDQITVSIESLKEIVQFIGTNYAQVGLTLNDVASACGINAGRVSELLAEHFQEVTFAQYLNMIRVYEAKRLLLSSEMNISEIGFTVGFSNVTHFNRTFKKILDITPSELRKEGSK